MQFAGLEIEIKNLADRGLAAALNNPTGIMICIECDQVKALEWSEQNENKAAFLLSYLFSKATGIACGILVGAVTLISRPKARGSAVERGRFTGPLFMFWTMSNGPVNRNISGGLCSAG